MSGVGPTRYPSGSSFALSLLLMSPAPFSPPDGVPLSATLLDVFSRQIAWLTSANQESKRALTAWLLASPPPPAGPSAHLAHARRLATRHWTQVREVLGPLPAASADGACEAITELLRSGEACLQTDRPEDERYAALLRVVQQLAACFGTACASAAETALRLGRGDLSLVLGSWAAAWREFQHALGQTEFPFTSAPAAELPSALSA